MIDCHWAMFGVTVNGRWHPGIGDPTVLGWVTVAAYLLAAVGCTMAARREPKLGPVDRDGVRVYSRFWLVLAVLLVALGINKQLDLQTFVTQVGRDLLRESGLYQDRRGLQVVFISAVALTCLIGLFGFSWAARRRLRTRWPAVAGMIFILGFVTIRAASFHHIDAFLGGRIGGMKWNWILELGGISAVAVSAFRVARLTPTPRKRPEGAAVYRYWIDPR